MTKQLLLAKLALAAFFVVQGPATAPVWAEPPPKVQAHAATKPLLFDARRHMPLSEVKTGMKGYGLSVYAGAQIKRFEVEVIAVLRNIFGPAQDAILIRCLDDYLTHTGPVEGMSGSPVYLFDAAGNARMIGALAYGWEAQKDPVVGVQPIENMLGLVPQKPEDPPPAQNPGAAGSDAASYSLLDADVIPSLSQLQGVTLLEFLRGTRKSSQNPAGPGTLGSGTPGWGTPGRGTLRPLATPLAVSGLSGDATTLLTESLSEGPARFSIRPLAGASMVAMPGGDVKVPQTLEPGSTLIAPVVMGDLDAAAVGTATEVIGDRVMGFGHPFNGDGPIIMPMATGTIATIIATNATSFKMGAAGKLVGAIDTDTTFGVAGNIGQVPPMIPLTVNLKQPGNTTRTFNYQLAWHPMLTPRLAAMTVMGSAIQRHRLPPEHTLDYNVRMEFGKHLLTKDAPRVIEFANSETSLTSEGLVRQVAGPIMAMSDNPFGRLLPRRITIDVNVIPTIRSANILKVTSDRHTYRPGQTVQLSIRIRKFRGDDAIIPAVFKLPDPLDDGVYQIDVTDSISHTLAELQSSPGQFDAKSPDDIAWLFNNYAGKRNDAIYIRLVPQMPRVDMQVGRRTLLNLPGSLRSRLSASASPDLKPATRTWSSVVASDVIVDGSAQVTIKIEKE